jgi:hypothetical protein
MLTLNDVLTPSPDVISRESDGELVVVLPQDGTFFVLNGTGAEIFGLLDGQRPLDAIAAALNTHYPGSALEQVQADVLAFAEKILQRGAALKR